MFRAKLTNNIILFLLNKDAYIWFQISPSSGPINGGTLLTVFTNREINDDDIIIINIDEDNCTVNNITEDNCS